MSVMQAVKIREIHAALPATDFERAKRWYGDKLGLKPVMESDAGAIYEIGNSHVLVYPSQFAGTNQATAATILVDDARQAAEAFRQEGIRLEEFDLPDAEWENGVARMSFGDQKAYTGWFKDSEGNTIAFSDVEIR